MSESEPTPVFSIKLNGSKIQQEQEVAVKSIIIIEIIDSVSIFYIRMADDAKRTLTDSTDWAEGTEVTIELGYKDDLTEVITGEITGIMPDFVKNSDDAVTFKGNSFLHRLARGRKTQSFSEMTDADIIKQLADAAELEHDIEDIGVEKPFTLQSGLTDAQYIMTIANSYNCRVWAEGKKLFVKPTEANSSGDVVLEWGKTLLDFDPRLTCRRLIDEVEVRGSKSPEETLVGTATCDDITFKIGDNVLGGDIAKENYGAAKAILLDANVKDQNAADKAALEYITANSMRYIKSTGRCAGNCKVKAGTMLDLKALGEKFSGKYFVTSVKHKFVPLVGFETFFFVEKNTGLMKTSAESVASAGPATPPPEKKKEEGKVVKEKESKFLEISLEEEDGEPVANESYIVTTASGKEIKGRLNKEGKAEVEVDDPNSCKVTFPNLDPDEWDV